MTDGRLRAVLANSRFGRALGLTERVDPTETSILLGAYRGLADSLGRAVEDSATSRLSARLADVVRHSWGYRWLTAEPEPDVVVIDLRGTWTVGPLLAGIERLIAWTGPYWRTSQIRALVARGGSVAAHSRLVQSLGVLSALFEQPSPSERASRDDDGAARTCRREASLPEE
jgi:hypothetical protein